MTQNFDDLGLVMLFPRQLWTDPERVGLRRLLEMVPAHRRVEAARAWDRIRQERNELALKNARQGDSMAGMGSCLDLTHRDYLLYRGSLAGGSLVQAVTGGVV